MEFEVNESNVQMKKTEAFSHAHKTQTNDQK